jgi:hypothetical protein
MKVLVATKESQGDRASDFSWTEEGELVCLPFECDRDKRTNDIDGTCGCLRSFSGFDTRKASTTAKVVERKLTKKQFVKEFEQAMTKAGWEFPKIEIECEADELLSIADHFAVGAVVEKRGSDIFVRSRTQAGA